MTAAARRGRFPARRGGSVGPCLAPLRQSVRRVCARRRSRSRLQHPPTAGHYSRSRASGWSSFRPCWRSPIWRPPLVALRRARRVRNVAHGVRGQMGPVGVGGLTPAFPDEPAAGPGISRGKLAAWLGFVSALAALSYYARYAIPRGRGRAQSPLLVRDRGRGPRPVRHHARDHAADRPRHDLRETLALQRPRSIGRAAWQPRSPSLRSG